MTDIAIRVENLSKLYHIGLAAGRHDTLRDALVSRLRRAEHAPASETDLWALKDVSFEVKRGEVVGVIGRNGAGKSTLLKILSRITEPTTGRAEIHGRVGSLLEVGTGFHPELTGRENIYLNGAILGMKRTEIAARFDEIVQFAEIEKFLDTPVKRYSSGMYVRLAFAVAAHLEPEILLVDEVLAVGDAQFQKKCLGKMSDVAHEGRTVLFVSHNMVAVQTLCQRALWLNSGLLVRQGPVSVVMAEYLNTGIGAGDTNERVWPDMTCAPGNESVRVRRIAVRPAGGKPGDPITMDTSVCIEIEYWNLLPGEHLHSTLHVFNDQGIMAFTAGPSDLDPALHVHPPIGLLRSVGHIPANLFNSGLHRVDLLLIRTNSGSSFKLDEAIGFDVIDDRDRAFGWYGREPGVVFPRIPFTVELVR